ncbi:MAG: hypothetical protein V9E96_14125 [Chitinophagaceae bacterium]
MQYLFQKIHSIKIEWTFLFILAIIQFFSYLLLLLNNESIYLVNNHLKKRMVKSLKILVLIAHPRYENS